MAGRNERDERDDPRLKVARYQAERMSERDSDEGDESGAAGQPNMEQRAQYVEIAIQQAIRNGDFDHLPGAGQPIENLHRGYHPDWWIRQKIEREKLTGLGPPALTLRTENAALDDRLDAATSEVRVREILDDFNRRVIEARRQLQGGPPVVTPTRDVEDEVDRWRARRESRQQAALAERQRADDELAVMTWRQRRRARRRI